MWWLLLFVWKEALASQIYLATVGLTLERWWHEGHWDLARSSSGVESPWILVVDGLKLPAALLCTWRKDTVRTLFSEQKTPFPINFSIPFKCVAFSLLNQGIRILLKAQKIFLFSVAFKHVCTGAYVCKCVEDGAQPWMCVILRSASTLALAGLELNTSSKLVARKP